MQQLVEHGDRVCAPLRWTLVWLGTAVIAWPLAVADDNQSVGFRKIQLTDAFHAEAAGLGDIDRDGHGDAVYGPFWYAGPDFKERHEIYAPKDFDPANYSNNFMTAVGDVDGDGWLDVLVNEWPGKEVFWFQNPRQNPRKPTGPWLKHLVHPIVDNESPTFLDITGDGRPELIFHTGGVLGFASMPKKTPTDRWVFSPCSEPEAWGQYTHGLGVGDVNGDNRSDLLMSGGWWEQPADALAVPHAWKKHPHAFGSGGAQMYAYDVDGDGDQDVITSLAAHAYGLAWFEQVKKGGSGEIDFIEHQILPAEADGNLAGVQFSQLHAVCLADVDGDGLKDIITGKRYWAHGPKVDADPSGTPLLYWFKLTRKPDAAGGVAADKAGQVAWTPFKIDGASGVGTQIAVGDLNGDKRPDIVVGNKKGGFVFLQETPAGSSSPSGAPANASKGTNGR